LQLFVSIIFHENDRTVVNDMEFDIEGFGQVQPDQDEIHLHGGEGADIQ
jgi:hypothetical protein